MSMIKFHNLYVLIGLFPAWLLTPNIYIYDRILYFLPYLLFLVVFIVYFKKEIDSKLKLIFLSIITTFTLDQNLSLYQNLIKPNFDFLNRNIPNLYFADLSLIIFLSFLVLILFFLLKANSIKIFFPFILVILIFKIYNVTTQPIDIINYDKTSKILTNNLLNKKTLIIVLDEMSGVNSTEKNFKYGDIFRNTAINLSSEHDLTLYTNTFSVSDNTANSVPFMLNLETRQPNQKIREKFIKSSLLNYNEYDLIQNKIFQKFENISVIQNVHLNFCNQKNVKKCFQINPYIKKKDFLKGHKNNFFTHFFSLWSIDGSTIARLFFKFSRILNVSDSILEPEAHKIFLPLILSKLENDIIENKFDLIFAHILAPHLPYGFSQNCEYDGNKSSFNSYMQITDKYIQHNIERICMIKFISNFLNNIKSKSNYKNLNILIMSDHGSRISSKEKLTSILMTKIDENTSQIVEEKILIHNEIKKIFLNNYN